MCRGPAEGWDHVKPIRVGGSHLLANLRPACRPCNSRKRSSWPLVG
ncbi:MAG: HNH endonuclease [Acidimicrobiia bacterium]